MNKYIKVLARCILGFGVLGIAFKLGSILGGNYYWPMWPNIVDVLTLGVAGVVVIFSGRT